jgi:hypothetical protein
MMDNNDELGVWKFMWYRWMVKDSDVYRYRYIVNE